ncbi:MAG: hypothetical protein MUC88_07820 [Planctomycetes bacterium]|jgi:hypothetical protein|nr:hypothetical protein [Planctomycetota bacterium]
MRRILAVAACLLLEVGTAHARVERIWLSHKSTDPSRVVVNWETSEPGNSIVHYGTTPATEQTCTVEESVTLHHVEIPLPLQAAAHYYRVQTGPHRSPVASFKGYPQDELRVGVIADLQGRPALPGLIKDNVRIVMTAGDNIANLWQGCNGRKDWTGPYSRLIDAYPELFRTTIFMPVLGNHDKEIRPRGAKPPPEAVYDVNATAFRTFFELPDEEWKWHLDVPGFDVRFIALDLNHISDMGTTWQACHPFAVGSEQFEWYDRLTQPSGHRFIVTLYNEQNASMRNQEGRRWHGMFCRGTLCITGFGYFAERAVFEGHPYFNTSVSGKGDRYPDPHSQFLAGEDTYILLTFHRQPCELLVEIKALDGTLLDRTRHPGRSRGE